MKFKLSTLLLLVTSIACTTGWFCEVTRNQQAQIEWDIKEAKLKAEFAKKASAVFSGSDALASAEVANNILSRLEPLVPANNKNDFDFDTDRDFVDQTAIKTIIDL